MFTSLFIRVEVRFQKIGKEKQLQDEKHNE